MWDKTLKELHQNLERREVEKPSAETTAETTEATETNCSWLENAYETGRESLRRVLLVLVVGIVCANLLVFAYVLLMYVFGLADNRRPRDESTEEVGDKSSRSRAIRSSVVQAVGIACLLTSIPTLTAILILGRTLSRPAISS